MTENYRSTGHIIAAANSVIEPARLRMKADHPITVNRIRARERFGGAWERIDPVTQGRVQILPSGSDPLGQAHVVVEELKRMASLDPGWDWSRCAVIARNWDLLDPVRALCHQEEIPAQVAREDFTATWQLRETQALLEWTRDQGCLLKADGMLQWLTKQPEGPWTELLIEAIENYQEETNDEELPAASFREWLAEWARDYRRRQHGLLLTSSHRAKGLEFDHVAILDGGWSTAAPGEDIDGPRRLYYVAMTRARRTLTLAKTGDSNPFLRLLDGHPSVLARPGFEHVPPAPRKVTESYLRLSLRDVQLSFAGHRPPDHPIHQAIASLSAGGPLKIRTDRTPWEMAITEGVTVGRLSQGFKSPPGTEEASATVLAIAHWNKSKSEAEYLHLLRTDEWEVVIPEIVTRRSP